MLNKAKLFKEFKKHLIKWAATELLTVVAKNLPFLAKGPFGYLTSKFIYWFLELVFEKTTLGVNLSIIYFTGYIEVSMHKSNQNKFMQAFEKYGKIDSIPKEVVDEINQDLIKSGRKLIKLSAFRLPT